MVYFLRKTFGPRGFSALMFIVVFLVQCETSFGFWVLVTWWKQKCKIGGGGYREEFQYHSSFEQKLKTEFMDKCKFSKEWQQDCVFESQVTTMGGLWVLSSQLGAESHILGDWHSTSSNTHSYRSLSLSLPPQPYNSPLTNTLHKQWT